jgi:branched-chain amino acid transport system ATP-binding protein
LRLEESRVLGETSAEAADSAARQGKALLSVRDLSVAYAGAVQALREVSLDVADGAILGVLGGNGAGKTTLLRAISGTLAGQRGSVTGGGIELDGRALLGLDPALIARAGVVQVPEGRRIFGDLTVEDNLRAGTFGRVGRQGVAAAQERVLDLFPRLAERRHQRWALLSGGEQQMLAIARILRTGARFLMLDEPTEGLAPVIIQQIGHTIARLKSEGFTILLVEQNFRFASTVADRYYIVEHGKVIDGFANSELSANMDKLHTYLGV